MLITPHKITLDINKRNDYVYLFSKQNDTARPVEIQMQNDGVNIVLPVTANVTLNVTKPDGTYAKLPCTVTAEGTAICEFTNQALAAVGDAEFDVIALYTEDGKQKQISALNGRLFIQATSIPEDVIVSSNDFKALVDALLTTEEYKVQAAKISQLEVYRSQLDADLAALRATQAQMSNDTRLDLTGTGKVTAVPKNAAIMGVGGTIKGMTLASPVINGDFLQGTTGWNYIDAVNLGIAEKTATVSYANIQQAVSSFAQNKGHKIYVRARVKADSAQINVQISDGVGNTSTFHSGSNNFEEIAVIRTIDTNATSLIFKIQDNRTSGWTKFYVDWLFWIDLTALGLDTKSAADMANYCPSFFSGTQSEIAMRIKSLDSAGVVKSACYIEPCTLRRVPNGTTDIIDLASGKLTPNNNIKVLAASDVIGMATGVNVTWAKITRPADFIYPTSNMANLTAFALQDFPPKADADSVDNIGTSSMNNSTCFLVVFTKGTTLAQAQAALTGKKLIYQLAADKVAAGVKNNVISGSINAYPKGTIVCDNAVADAGMYNNGISILRTAYPISSIETLYKLNADGTQTPLDVSIAVIASGGLSFTHPSLTNGDIVAFTYFTASAGLIGENMFNYVNANGLVLGLDGKYYRVYHTVAADGTIGHAKTEVV